MPLTDRLTVRLTTRTVIPCIPTPRSPLMLQARVSCLRAQASLDALSKRPADVAWFEVMDALWTWVSEVPAPAKA